MPDDLVFWMGKFEAKFPTDRHYAQNHMWAKQVNGVWRFGFARYAVRLLQDVYFLDWTIEPEMVLKEKDEIGSIESKKAESSLYAPTDGKVRSLNEDLLQDPSGINVSPYQNGWLFELEAENVALLSPQEYLQFLEDVWKVTQRTIKGQLND